MAPAVLTQGTTQPAQTAPIPPVPPRAGAPTGATPTAPPGQSIRDEIRTQIQTDVRNAVQGARDAATAAGQSGQPVTIQQPPYSRNNDIPPEVIPLAGIGMTLILGIVLGFPIVRLITRVIERRTDKGLLRADDVNVQIRALQQSIDAMAIELERISESQRFQSKLMAERERASLSAGEQGRS